MRKKVLITGGSRGLGASIAEEYARHDYDIVLTYLTSQDDAIKIQEYLQKTYGVEVSIFHLDITDEKNIAEVVEQLDRLDSLINNAAYNNDMDPIEKTQQDFLYTLNTNLVGPFLLSKYCYKLLEESGGVIVNIASTNGIDTMYPESIDYDASKAGLINLTKNLAKYMAPKVRVNAIAPGWIETRATSDMSLDFRGQELSKISLKRFATPEEIAKTVYFVGSDNATYMTGSIIRIDGGQN